MQTVKITECPRDAMQGLHEFIPTEKKIAYMNKLMECDFDTLDFGSFVSPKAIPQMRDTAAVLDGMDLNDRTKLLAIVANERGAEDASAFDEINYLGYPFSVSEEFQKRNTNATIEESLGRLEKIQQITLRSEKKLVVYLSMGFGNPYGEAWNADVVFNWSKRLSEELGIGILALSDTIGCATPENVDYIFRSLIPALPEVEFGAHLHVLPGSAESILAAAWNAGCKRFDGAIRGFGGCPMAKDDLTGNMPTERMLAFFKSKNVHTGIDEAAFERATLEALRVFPV